MRIAYMGTPDFAVPPLEALLAAGHEIVLVVTQPDRPVGRGKKVVFSPVKTWALDHKIAVAQPEKLKDNAAFYNTIESLKLDCCVVAAYGKIIPGHLLKLPKYGFVNIHGSILPDYRGASPVQQAILNGDTQTGVTTIKMDEGLDTGPILKIDPYEIPIEFTSGDLMAALAILGGKTIVKTLQGLESGKLVPKEQNHEKATYTGLITKDMGCIDFKEPAHVIACKIRGMLPWPIAYMIYKKEKVKVLKGKVIKNNQQSYQPGMIIKADAEGLLISTGEDLILLEVLQFPNKKPMTVKAFLLGNSIETGYIF